MITFDQYPLPQIIQQHPHQHQQQHQQQHYDALPNPLNAAPQINPSNDVNANYGNPYMHNPLINRQQQPPLLQQPLHHLQQPPIDHTGNGTLINTTPLITKKRKLDTDLSPYNNNLASPTPPTGANNANSTNNNPVIKKKPLAWTKEEEDKLRNLVKIGTKWPEITAQFPNRSAGAIKKHFYADMKHTVWHEAEDNSLQQVYKEDEDQKWKRIGEKLGRPARACEKRMKELLSMKNGQYIPPHESIYSLHYQKKMEAAQQQQQEQQQEQPQQPQQSQLLPQPQDDVKY